MNEQEYLDRVKNAREQIEQGTTAALTAAAAKLDSLDSIRPRRIEYICACIALRLQRGADKELCRSVLDNIDQEFYPQKTLADVFYLKQQTFPADSLETRQVGFSLDMYRGEDMTKLYFQPLSQLKKQFMVNPADQSILHRLAEGYYVVRDMTMYAILMFLWRKQKKLPEDDTSWLRDDTGETNGPRLVNLEYLLRLLTASPACTFILVHGLQQESLDMNVLSKALQLLGHPVVILKPVLKSIQESEYSSTELTALCLDAAITKENQIIIRPVAFQRNGVKIGDNRMALIQFLTKNLEQKLPMLAFASDQVMDELHSCLDGAKEFQRMTACQPDQLAYTTAFAWAGSYLKYISFLYGFDAEQRINQPAECEFSIVLPVRNSVDTLRYTLQTCLKQQFQGDYEIVLSDNSDAGNQAVYDLCREINNPHIHYYRTPFVLELAKSFEFAFLQARGEFIFSLGADDGVYPWTLSMLHEVLSGMKGSDILLWQRGFYAWPGFNHGQQHQLIIPLFDFAQEQMVYSMEEHAATKKVIAAFGGNLYTQPLLYINSGFKRSYFRRLWHRTGRLWDGASQDVAMGVINLVINEIVPYSCCPLTIAGMSGHSIGAETQSIVDSLDAFARQMQRRANPVAQGRMGAYVQRRQEYKFPRVENMDILAFFWEMLRLVDMGCFTEEELADIDLGKMFATAMQKRDVDSIGVMRDVGYIRYAASQWGKSIVELVDQMIDSFIQPTSKVVSSSSDRQYYVEGIDAEAHCLTLNASRYGVKNIVDAVELSVQVICENQNTR